MKDLMPLVTIFVSGLFSLAVVLVTNLLTGRKEEAARRRQVARSRYDELTSVYADALACVEKCIREVVGHGSFPGLQESLATNSARIGLVAPEKIVAQSHAVGDLIHEWSAEHRRGQPKPIGPKELNARLISSEDTPHREKASELYPQLMGTCTDFANMMRAHLDEVRASL